MGSAFRFYQHTAPKWVVQLKGQLLWISKTYIPQKNRETIEKFEKICKKKFRFLKKSFGSDTDTENGPWFRWHTNNGRSSEKKAVVKVENILKGSLDSIPSPSPSVKIQIMGGKICLTCKGKTLLGIVNKLLKTKRFLTVITQHCFASLTQVNFPANNLNFH